MNQLLIAFAALLTAAIPVIVTWLKVKLGPQRLATVAQLAQVAVQASEKLGEQEGITSADKYAAAEKFLIEAAKRVGVKLSTNEANGFIQSAINVVTGK